MITFHKEIGDVDILCIDDIGGKKILNCKFCPLFKFNEDNYPHEPFFFNMKIDVFEITVYSESSLAKKIDDRIEEFRNSLELFVGLTEDEWKRMSFIVKTKKDLDNVLEIRKLLNF